MTGDPLPTFCTTSEAAERLGLSHYTVREHVRKGVIPAVKIGSRWYVNLDQLAERMRDTRQVAS